MFALLLIRAFYNHCATLLIAGMLFYCAYSNLLPVQLKSNTFRISSQIYWLAKMSSFALKCVIFFLCVSVCCTCYCTELKCLWRSLRPRLFFGSFNSNWMVVDCLFKAANSFSWFCSWADWKGEFKKEKPRKTSLAYSCSVMITAHLECCDLQWELVRALIVNFQNI